MTHLRSICTGFLRDQSGQDLIEYALAAALIGLAAVVSIRSLASHISTAFGSVGTSLTSAV